MIHYNAIENRVLTIYFWWLLVSAPYYVAKLVIASQRAERPFLDTKKGKVFAYSVGALAGVILTSWVGGSLQNRIVIFTIMLVPTILGVFSGFSGDKVLPVAGEDYVTAAQRKVNGLGNAITSSPNPTCIPISQLPYPISEVKEAIQRLYLYSSNDVEYRMALQMAYMQLADFVPDGKAEVVRLWHQSVDAIAAGKEGITLGQEGVRITKEMQAHYNLLGEEWDSWLRSVEPNEVVAE